MRVGQPAATAVIRGKLGRQWSDKTWIVIKITIEMTSITNREPIDVVHRAIWNHIVCRWMGGSIWNGTRAHTVRICVNQWLERINECSLLADKSRSRCKLLPLLQLRTRAHSFIVFIHTHVRPQLWCWGFFFNAFLLFLCLIVWNTC